MADSLKRSHRPQKREGGRILDFRADSNPEVLDICLSLTTSRGGFNSEDVLGRKAG